MSKGKNIKKEGNVIYFPGLEERLLEKGLQHLHKNQIAEAIDAFEFVLTVDPTNRQSHIGLLLSYFDAGMYDEAICLGKKMLQEDIGYDVEAMNIYITLLIQMHKYDEVISVIDHLRTDNKIPAEKLDNFQSLLQLSKRMHVEPTRVDTEDETDPHPHVKKLNLFQCSNNQEQMVLVSKLNTINITPFIKEMTHFLESDHGDPFLKTLILNVLKEHQYSKQIKVYKFDMITSIIPEYLPDVTENNQLQKVLYFLGEKLENEDPTLFSNIKALVERQFFLLYPFEIDTIEPRALAAAYHAIGIEYFGYDVLGQDLWIDYEVTEAALSKAKFFIRTIEQNSYPNL